MYLVVGPLILYLLVVLGGAVFHSSHSAQLRRRALRFERDYIVGDSVGAPLTMWVLGDSFAMGYGADAVAGTLPFLLAEYIASRGHAVRVRNLSQSGAYLRDVPDQLAGAEVAVGDLIVVLVGGMDTTHLTPLPIYREHLASLIRSLECLNCRQVLFSGSPDMSRGPAFPCWLKQVFATRCRGENAVVRDMVSRSSLTHVDLFADGKLERRHYSADGDHPNDKGYALWSAVFARCMEAG